MRNLKKILALVLALMMTLSLMVTANASEYTDADKVSEDYEVAVEVLSGMGIFQGDNKGQFLPDTTLNRKDASVLVYRVLSGDVDDERLGNYAGYAAEQFSDVSASAWYEPYVAYAALNGYIQGYAGKFNPDAPLTGVELLTILLRAVGYDVNGEFSIDWVNTVTKQAAAAGIDVPGVVLNAPVTREVTAEIIFQVIDEVKTVVYTSSLGYYTAEIVGSGLSTTLGKKVFKLSGPTPTTDDWGRPGYKYTYSTGDKSTSFAYAPAASYITKVDECDIAKDLGLKKAADIELAYIDGVKYAPSKTGTIPAVVTSNEKATIDPLATTSLVGGQGRITEVYAMEDGLRIVEINTWLGVVKSVKAATTDKNGHTTDRKITVNVYDRSKDGYTAYTVVTDDFAKGDYVLVTLNAGGDEVEIVDIKDANIVSGGKLVDWTNGSGTTPATSTVGSTTYKDADKFVLNRNVEGTWAVALDDNGNIIGLVPVATNYLVIEKIQWMHGNKIDGGYAEANIILADGSKVSGVVIDTIGEEDANNVGDKDGKVEDSNVSDNHANNTDYYGHIFTYSVNDDDSYNIAAHKKADEDDDEAKEAIYDEGFEDKKTDSVTITQGEATISGKVNTYVATSNTVFLIQNSDGYTYEKYVGKANVPSGTADTMCVLTDADGYAALVVLTGFVSKDSTFVAYVTDIDLDTRSIKLGDGYYVYKVGETTTTTVYDPDDLLVKVFAGDKTTAGVGTGLYEISVNSKGQVTKATAKVADLQKSASWPDASTGTSTYKYDNVNYNRAVVVATEKATSIQTGVYTSITAEKNDNGYKVGGTTGAYKDFTVTDETVIIKVTKTALNGTAKVAAGDIDDVEAGDVVIVGYTTSPNVAKVIYVFESKYTAEADPVYTAKVVKTTMDSVTGAEIEVELLEDKVKVELKEDDNPVSEATVTVYNEKGQKVYSTEVTPEVTENGTLIIKAPHTLTAGDAYKAVVELTIGSGDDAEKITTATEYIEAQTAVTPGTTDDADVDDTDTPDAGNDDDTPNTGDADTSDSSTDDSSTDDSSTDDSSTDDSNTDDSNTDDTETP